MMGVVRNSFFLYVLILSLVVSPRAYSAEPVLTDSRIKTYVYNDSEVFKVTAHYGYSTYIEFAESESPSYLQFGDPLSWGYDVVGNKLFLRVIDGFSQTNMTVISNLGRTYQFDIQSKIPPAEIDNNLTYVVRFFYPDNSFDRLELAKAKPVDELPLPSNKQYNFDYTMVGPDSIAPTAVFDDGKSTYFKFSSGDSRLPNIFMLDASGAEIPVELEKRGNFMILDRITNQYTIRLGVELVCIFNEANYNKHRGLVSNVR
ncbi:MAG: TrbG/VirB9 family P-type conjugative transfer protein [Rickettsiales bacterium]|nr:TrbG/VirB9 family P-type conjugative transfer protein [Rickettsiales bacterium]